jgi:DNA-binding NtrC family response regulator
MRPPKHILLVGENDAAMAPLRFALRNSEPCYMVTTANSADEVCNLLAEGSFDMMLVQLPVTPLEPFLERVNKIDSTFPVLVMNVINKPSMAEILDRIKVMTARKRGPKPGSHHEKETL